MRRPTSRNLLVLALTVAACADEAAPTVKSLVRAERAFARASLRDGMKAAFLGVLADGAVLFQPGPVDGRAFWEARTAPTASLDWAPELAATAAAGDLGFTTGPYRFAAGPDAAVVHGYYVSLWRHARGTGWRLALDAGTANPGPADTTFPATAATWDAAPASDPRPPDRERERAAFLETLDAFAAALATDPVAAYGRFGAGTMRLHRTGAAPRMTGSAVRDWLVANAAPRAPVRTGWGVSRTMDLGYAYGVTAMDDARFAFVRIWRRARGGWRIVIDVASPMPPAEPG